MPETYTTVQQFVDAGGVVTQGNCPATLSIVTNMEQVEGADTACPSDDIFIITYTIANDCGSEVSCSQQIAYEDTEAPICVAEDMEFALDEGTPFVTISVEDVVGGITDNCGCELNYTLSQTEFSVINYGVNTVTLTVTDASGNSSVCDFSVEIVLPPPSGQPDPCSGEEVCGDGVDNDCDGLVDEDCLQPEYCTLTQEYYGGYYGDQAWTMNLLEELLTEPLVLGLPGQSFTIADPECVMALLPSGNSLSILPVGDHVSSLGNCSGNVPVRWTGRIRSVILGEAITLALNLRNDVHLAALPLSEGYIDVPEIIIQLLPENPNVGDVLDLANRVLGGEDVGLHDCDYYWMYYAVGIINYSLLDCINTSTIELSCVSNTTIPCGGTLPAAYTTVQQFVDAGGVVTSSGCDGALTISSQTAQVSGAGTACSSDDTFVRTYTVSNECELSVTCEQQITYQDTEAPICVATGHSVTVVGAGSAAITANDINAGSSDACSCELYYDLSQTVFTAENAGSNNVTLTVTDESGNSTTCDVVIEVIVNEPDVNCGEEEICGDGIDNNCNGLIDETCLQDEYCTYSHKDYGGYWGASWTTMISGVIDGLLADGPLVVGLPGQSLTITSSACVVTLLPSGTALDELPSGDVVANSTCGVGSIPTRSDGSVGNILLGETVVLTLNTRLDPYLGYMPLNESCISFPAVIMNLLGANPTVNDVLDLANRVLGGENVGLHDCDYYWMYYAVGIINVSFIDCVAPCTDSLSFFFERQRLFKR